MVVDEEQLLVGPYVTRGFDIEDCVEVKGRIFSTPVLILCNFFSHRSVS